MNALRALVSVRAMHRRSRVSVGRGGAKGGEMVKGSDG